MAYTKAQIDMDSFITMWEEEKCFVRCKFQFIQKLIRKGEELKKVRRYHFEVTGEYFFIYR